MLDCNVIFSKFYIFSKLFKIISQVVHPNAIQVEKDL